MNPRLFHAFKFSAALDKVSTVTSDGKYVLVICNQETDGINRMKELLSDEKDINRSRILWQEFVDLYSEDGLHEALETIGNPESYWLAGGNEPPEGFDSESASIPLVILLDHGNRTQNLATLLAKTSVTVISACPFKVLLKESDNEYEPNHYTKHSNPDGLYGKPQIPEFLKMTDAQFARCVRDNTRTLDDLFPVYDFEAKVTDLNEFVALNIPPRDSIIRLDGQPLFFEESINEIPAFRGTGKTLFSLFLALLIAAGKSALSFQVSNKRRVLYVEGELPASQTQDRLKQLIHGLGIEIEKGYFTLFAKSLQEKAMGQAAITITTEDGRKAIEAKLAETGATVLFLDSISSLGRFATNHEENWIPVTAWFQDLRCKGITVIFLHQTGKGNEQRGHSISDDALDLIVKLTSTPGKPSDIADFSVTFPKVREAAKLEAFRISCTAGVWKLEGKNGTPKKKPSKREQARELLNQGTSIRQIAQQLKVSSKTIGEIKKELNQHGHPSEAIAQQ